MLEVLAEGVVAAFHCSRVQHSRNEQNTASKRSCAYINGMIADGLSSNSSSQQIVHGVLSRLVLGAASRQRQRSLMPRHGIWRIVLERQSCCVAGPVGSLAVQQQDHQQVQ